MTILEQLREGSRAVVIRLRSLGDCVLTTPALALLKNARPDLAIAVAVEDRFASVFEGNPSVSSVLAPDWRAIRNWKPRLCLNFHGGTPSLWMTALSGAQFRAGFTHHSTTLLYNIKIPRAQSILGVNRTVHTAEHLASAVFALGVPIQDIPRAQLFAAEPPIRGRYAVLHPFASAPEKQWPAERFLEVARYLTLWHVKPVFVAAPGDDAAPFCSYEIVQGSLREAKTVISGAALFIGNDSGPAHIAAAFGIPAVVFFSTSNPVIWGPWRTESEIVIAPEGMRNIPVSRAIAAIERLRTLEEAHA